MKFHVYPSILSAHLVSLLDEIRTLEAAGVDGLHVDIMDGHFVPNLTFGPSLVEQIRSQTTLFLDVHLMTQPSKPWVMRFLEAGANRITFHPSTEPSPMALLAFIKDQGIQAGIALNPDEDIPLSLLPFVDVVLVMSVVPGFSGQKFLPEVLPKIEQLREENTRPFFEICVDGGIDADTVHLVKEAGAHSVVVGNYFFQEPRSDQERMRVLRGAA